MEITSGVRVSPMPSNTPSRMIEAPKTGSDTATIRSTLCPSSMTCSSGVKRDIMNPGKRNRIDPVTAMTPAASRTEVRATLASRLPSPAPSALPQSVAAAACMP